MNKPPRTKKPAAASYSAPEAIRAIRTQAGLTPQEAARLINVTDKAWLSYEEGQARMPAALFELLGLKCIRPQAFKILVLDALRRINNLKDAVVSYQASRDAT